MKKGQCHGILTVTMALLQSSHGILLHSYRVLFGNSLCSHDAFTALTMRVLRFQGVHTVLTACWRRRDISKNAIQSPCKRHRRPRRLHNNPCKRPWSSYCVVFNCVVGDFTVRLWWPYGDPTALLLECRATPFVFSIVRAVIQGSMQSHTIYWRCHCLAAEMLAIILLIVLHFSWTLWDCHENAGVLDHRVSSSSITRHTQLRAISAPSPRAEMGMRWVCHLINSSQLEMHFDNPLWKMEIFFEKLILGKTVIIIN